MKTLRLLVYVIISGVSGYAQQNSFVCNGAVKDDLTKSALPNVRIYYRDTIPVYSDENGQFHLQAKTGDKLHFRKAGYGWHTEKITAETLQTVYLAPSSSVMIKKDFGKEAYNPDRTDYIYDGKLVPFEEWDDAYSTPQKEISVLRITKAIYKDPPTNLILIQKNKVIMTSIFQYNQ